MDVGAKGQQKQNAEATLDGRGPQLQIWERLLGGAELALLALTGGVADLCR